MLSEVFAVITAKAVNMGVGELPRQNIVAPASSLAGINVKKAVEPRILWYGI